MRFAAAVALTVVLALPPALRAQSPVVGGFRGYAWGTDRSAVSELATGDTAVAGWSDGLPFYSRVLSFLGRDDVLTGFYFHPDTGGLIEGAYVMGVPLKDCESTWQKAVDLVEQQYPGLHVEQRVSHREGHDLQVYDSDCEYFVYNDNVASWEADFLDPGPGLDEILMWMKPVGRNLRLTVVYRSDAGKKWRNERSPEGR